MSETKRPPPRHRTARSGHTTGPRLRHERRPQSDEREMRVNEEPTQERMSWEGKELSQGPVQRKMEMEPLRKESAGQAGSNEAHINELQQQLDFSHGLLSQKSAELEQAKIDADEDSKAFKSHIYQLEKALQDHHASAVRREAEYRQNLQQRDGKIKQLNESLSNLRKEHEALGSLVVGAQESALESMVKKSGWSAKEDPVIQEEFSKLQDKLRGWARKHGTATPEDLEKVPGPEKDAIINQLGSYCNQPDWQSFMEKASIPRKRVPPVLLQALLAREIFEWAFTDAFFAFAGVEADPRLPPSEVWANISRAMAEVNVAESHIWRSQTLRILCTPTDPENDSVLVRRTHGLVHRRAPSFLAGPASLLLGPTSSPEQHRKRAESLERLYQEAAQFALSLWAQRTFMVPYSTRELPKFSIADPRMSPHRLHQLDEDDPRLDGKEVLLCVQPAIMAFGNEDAENYDLAKIWAAATVVVDEKS